ICDCREPRGALRRSAARLSAAIGVLLGALALAGCGIGLGPPGVRLVITRNFGGQVLSRSGILKAGSHETVLGLLRAHDAVVAGSSPYTVQRIAGVAAGQQGGSFLRWFDYVNGLAVSKRLLNTTIHPGDHVWWDLNEAAQEVPAVVGSYPEPFLNGLEGKRLPVRIECATATASACQTVISRLRALGVPAAVSAIGSGAAPETLRVMVAPWSRLEGVLAQELERGPESSGVYARFSQRGKELQLLDPQASTTQTLTSGAGLIAALRAPKEAPVWVITGTDQLGVDRAARSLDEATLANRFAVALDPAGALALPRAAG
ncbi:MAG: hypothetical protein ACRDJX_00655, partial [Solirubrobacteraceae bacterium]